MKRYKDGVLIDSYTYNLDAHGNVVALADKDGNRIVNYKYDAWGNLTNQPEAVTTYLTSSEGHPYFGTYRITTECPEKSVLTGYIELKARIPVIAFFIAGILGSCASILDSSFFGKYFSCRIEAILLKRQDF